MRVWTWACFQPVFAYSQPATQVAFQVSVFPHAHPQKLDHDSASFSSILLNFSIPVTLCVIFSHSIIIFRGESNNYVNVLTINLCPLTSTGLCELHCHPSIFFSLVVLWSPHSDTPPHMSLTPSTLLMQTSSSSL